MNYQQTIDYLYKQLPMFSRIGAAAYKKDLHNTIALCDALNNPQTTFKSIHIAGTNGKGSTSHMLAAILQQAGYKTGLYTSPHLKDFKERIKINGEMISEDFVVDFVERNKTLSESIEPSFFELTVAMAFDYFAKQKVDIAVIETGLGGRLDSTNIITPILSIITNIGYDHMNILGNTLEEIAHEKAGIIKPTVPVVIGENLAETKSIFFNKAKEGNSKIYFAQEDYKVSNITATAQLLHCDVTNIEENITENFSLDLNGIYQTKNLCTVLCAEGILMQLGFNIKNETEKFALSNTKKITGLHGRWDVIAENPTIVLDVAHNEDGIKQILKQLSINNNQTKNHFVLGMVKDKEVDKVLSLLPTDAEYYFTNAHIPRALPAQELQTKAAVYNLKGDFYDNVNMAINAAKQNAEATDLIIVCGSVFLVGEVDVPADNENYTISGNFIASPQISNIKFTLRDIDIFFEVLTSTDKVLKEFFEKYIEEEYKEIRDQRLYYIDITEISRYIINKLKTEQTEYFTLFFNSVEEILKSCDAEIENLIVIGLFESIQNISTQEINYHTDFNKWLKPISKSKWDELINFWEGKYWRTNKKHLRNKL